MRRSSMFGLGFCVVISMLTLSAQQQRAGAGAYQNRCASCHGTAMTGATAPAILAYVKYHTDKDVTAALAQKHPNLAISGDELSRLLADMRALAGTNPAMATGGYTGRRG